MKNFCKHEGKKVLLVEGKDDCHVILALCAHFNIPETFGTGHYSQFIKAGNKPGKGIYQLA